MEHQLREVTLDILFKLLLGWPAGLQAGPYHLEPRLQLCRAGKILLEVRLLLLVRISHFQRQENTGGLLSQQAVGPFFRQLILNGSKRFLFRTRPLRLIRL